MFLLQNFLYDPLQPDNLQDHQHGELPAQVLHAAAGRQVTDQSEPSMRLTDQSEPRMRLTDQSDPGLGLTDQSEPSWD